jgi:hypothetical protein
MYTLVVNTDRLLDSMTVEIICFSLFLLLSAYVYRTNKTKKRRREKEQEKER